MSEIGTKRKLPVIEDAKNDLAVAISRHMKRHGLTLKDLRERHGYSERRTDEISRFLRGNPEARWGLYAALDLAERLKIPARVCVGEDARAT